LGPGLLEFHQGLIPSTGQANLNYRSSQP
jgi:hypothetical protein